MEKRRLLRNTKIIISNDVTREKHSVLKEAVKRLGRKNVWCLDGKIFCKKKGREIQIKGMDDI